MALGDQASANIWSATGSWQWGIMDDDTDEMLRELALWADYWEHSATEDEDNALQ